MGLGDLFKASENTQLKSQIEDLHKKIAELEEILTPEHRELHVVIESIQQKKAELDELIAQKQVEMSEMVERKQREVDCLQQRANTLNTEIVDCSAKLSDLKAQIIQTDETVLLQSFGLYEPHYAFATSAEYKDRLDKIRKTQKSMIKDGTACTGSQDWTVNGSASKGKKMVKDMQKLLLRAFNSECDELIANVKFHNIESSIKRITASKDAISKLGAMVSVQITNNYFNTKIEELYLSHEYQLKKQQEKEELKRIRAEQREQAKLEKEIEQARKKLEKEQTHCKNELSRMLNQDTSSMTEDEKNAFNAKKTELESQLKEIEKGISDVDYRAANQKAGYVYIISNIGSFGENVYKIGMTRRLEPMDRIDELGDASVPFNFDVHAMIFSEDAPALEAALHRAFEDRKINMINTRREFFHVTLEEIKQVVKDNFDKTVEFTEIAPAEQYRESLLMRNGG